MEFKENANVFDNQGKKVGEIERVVLDPNDGMITHLIVRKGFLFTTDKVLPVDMVSRSDDDEIHLRVSKERLEELPEFVETNYLPLDTDEIARHGYGGYNARPMYWYPALGASPIMWGAGYWGTYPPAAAYPYRLRTKVNIPEGTVALEEGAKVYGADGEHVGDVEKVMTENKEDEVSHLVITKGLFGHEKKMIPAHWIKGVGEEEVRLSVDSKMVEKLEEYKE